MAHGTKIWIFGGRNARDYLNDLYAFDTGAGLSLKCAYVLVCGSMSAVADCFPVTKRWLFFEPKPGQVAPRPRAHHASLIYKGRVYIYGGKTRECTALGDIHYFDIGTHHAPDTKHGNGLIDSLVDEWGLQRRRPGTNCLSKTISCLDGATPCIWMVTRDTSPRTEEGQGVPRRTTSVTLPRHLSVALSVQLSLSARKTVAEGTLLTHSVSRSQSLRKLAFCALASPRRSNSWDLNFQGSSITPHVYTAAR